MGFLLYLLILKRFKKNSLNKIYEVYNGVDTNIFDEKKKTRKNNIGGRLI